MMNVTVTEAGSGDLETVLTGVRDLLRELSGDPARTLGTGAREAIRAIIGDRAVGTILVASTDAGETVGVLSASCQVAIRTAGWYLLIQELYVRPGFREIGIGQQLIRHLVSDAEERGLPLIEVGLPGSGFESHSRTRSFYLRQGFTDVGPRMRCVVQEGE